MARTGLVALFAAALFVAPPPAGAAPPSRMPGVQALDAGERQALEGGATVSRPVRFERGEGSYIGGVAYQVVNASPARVLAALSDVGALPRALPRTERATLVSRDGRRTRIELVQGKAPFLATYTLNLEQESAERIRFWLDPTRPHDVKDVWGYFRVKPFGKNKTLVTLAVALDMGPGLARWLLSDRVERIILRAPGKIREYVEPERLTSAR
ncbi:MAG TPA: SRPBCC family protein [Polyangiaceae bacterium]|nr:SRPBCC family protein [Polyangiaceae bacterium]